MTSIIYFLFKKKSKIKSQRIFRRQIHDPNNYRHVSTPRLAYYIGILLYVVSSDCTIALSISYTLIKSIETI